MSVLAVEQHRATLAEALRARRPEIEQTALARVRSIADPARDPEYVEGLRNAVSAALDYAIAVLEHQDPNAPEVPHLLLEQARLAAHNGVSLDTILRRYFAGFALFGSYVLREAGDAGQDTMRWLLQVQATQFDHLLAAVSEAYTRAKADRFRSSDQRLAERVKRMIDGELLDNSGLDYDFDVWQLGMVASGSGASGAIRRLACRLDRRLMLVRPEEKTVWAWLGGRTRMSAEDIGWPQPSSWPDGTTLAVGEPAKGMAGWRLTHRQAKAGLAVAVHGRERCTRYADVALLASILHDDLLVSSLRRIYLDPLREGTDDAGEELRRTLRAYFEAGRNISAAAGALSLNRRTVSNRLREIEDRIGRPLTRNTADIEAALRLAAQPAQSPASPSPHWGGAERLP